MILIDDVQEEKKRLDSDIADMFCDDLIELDFSYELAKVRLERLHDMAVKILLRE